jgi:hypothetical protein
MLHMDPDIQMQFDEPPYRERRQLLYAPAAPFMRAIREWLDTHEAAFRASPYYGIERQMATIRLRKGQKPRLNQGIGLLGRYCGLETHSISRILNGEQEWVELRTADKLAIGLGIPLPLLADDFRPRSETTNRKAAR